MLSDLLPNERVFLDFCDREENWGLLLFLRPAQQERMSALRTGAGALLLGIPLGLLATILLAFVAHALGRPAPKLVEFPLLLTLGYWGIAHATLARAWNQRAARLVRLARWGAGARAE